MKQTNRIECKYHQNIFGHHEGLCIKTRIYKGDTHICEICDKISENYFFLFVPRKTNQNKININCYILALVPSYWCNQIIQVTITAQRTIYCQILKISHGEMLFLYSLFFRCISTELVEQQ